MTSRQAAVIASRVLCVWFIYEAVTGLWSIPALIVLALEQSSRLHALNVDRIGYGAEWGLLLPALTGVIRLIVNAALAIFFYRSSSGLIRFLTAGEADPETTEDVAIR